jgi:hypothetical protein
VANIVGILIILVMVTGVRAKHWSGDEVPQPTVKAAAAALEKDLATEAALRRDVAAHLEQQRQVEREASLQNRVRMQLATAVAAVERGIASGREQLDAEGREGFRLRQELAGSRSELDRLRHEHAMALAAEAAPTLIESYPTPLSEAVDGEEIHFQLREGRVVFIPLERLLERFKEDARRKMHQLFDLPDVTGTVGPEGGFRLRYTMVRRDVPLEMQAATGSGVYAELERWTLIPIAGELGEPIETALAERSRFREVLACYRPDTTTVTVWTYADSFAAFRRLKRATYRLGFATAARPLPEGTPIGGSPKGTKSAAQ